MRVEDILVKGDFIAMDSILSTAIDVGKLSGFLEIFFTTILIPVWQITPFIGPASVIII
jgi:membrane protein CcdC involved in cytochrome C biogenesis